VRDALTLLPDGAERIRIIVNSADVALLQESMAQTGTLTDSTVVGSNEVQRGGCRITSPCGDIDATLETRIARVMDVLSASNEQPK
jgi:flagellar assembly protein FliH